MKITDEMVLAGADVASSYGVLEKPGFELAHRILEAALSASPAGVVKPLEWKQTVIGDGTVLRQNAWISGHYQIVESPSGKYDLRGDTYVICDTLKEAQTAAFADYSARIMSAIEPAGVTMTMQPLGDEFQAAIGDREGLYEPAGVGVETAPPLTPAQGINFPYQRTFDAIAAATKIEGGAIAISVRAFREAWDAHQKRNQSFDNGLAEVDEVGDASAWLFHSPSPQPRASVPSALKGDEQ